MATATVAILALSWLGLLVAKGSSSLEVGGWALALPHLSLLALMLFFSGLALLLSLVLPARRSAAMAAGLVLLTSYFLTTLARLDKDLETLSRLAPTSYYQSGDAIDGLNVRWFAGLLASAAAFVALAWWRFERRDIRVAGEGVWRWRLWRRVVGPAHPPAAPSSPPGKYSPR
jgi:ABC-2 type transport system permease protein